MPPKGSLPIPPHYRERIKESWPRVQPMARERFGLELNRPEMEGDDAGGVTRLAHIGAKYALEHGKDDAYRRAVFRAYWQAGRDISAPEVLAQIAVSVGLEEAPFRAALTNPDCESAVEADEYWAFQHELGGVPAFIFADRYLVSGARPAVVLRQVADTCLAEGLAQ